MAVCVCSLYILLSSTCNHTVCVCCDTNTPAELPVRLRRLQQRSEAVSAERVLNLDHNLGRFRRNLAVSSETV